MTKALYFKILTFCILVLSVLSCIKEKPVTVDFEVIQLPSALAVTKIIAENDSVIWASLGNKFGRGAIFKSTDAGLNWNQILDSDYEIRDIKFFNGRIYAFPIGNTVLWTDNQGVSWQNHTMPGWEFFSAGTPVDSNLIALVGGENFGKGILHRISPIANASFFVADTFQHELSDIIRLNDSTIITVGFGVILKSTDRGVHWLPDEARGDFFRAVSFADDRNGFVAGDYGSIHKTTDGGNSWKKIKSGSTFFNTNNRFRDIHFFNADDGTISGNNGLIWYTHNAGKTWIPISKLPNIDFQSVLTKSDKIFAGAEGGKIIIMNKP